MKEFITMGYSYNELDDVAKEEVKQWYLAREWRNESFYELIIEYLKNEFPNSKLTVMYSLSYCQGDGLNISGKLNMYDFIDKWDAHKLHKRLIEQILDKIDHWYNFAQNNHYCYSCKFIDRKHIDEDVSETISELQDAEFDCGDCTEIIKKFYTDLVDYFEELDALFEKDGYKYLYECDEEEVADFCEANKYYFTEDGKFIE